MPIRYNSSLFRAATALAFVLALAACTKGGQFDPTEMFNSDMFDTKTKLKGDRIPVFPNGVPGATTGIPPDLVKGYQPPPEQADATALPAAPAAPAEAAKPKPKPKPKVAIEKPPSSRPTRITVGPKPSAPAQKQAEPSQTAWPAPPPQNAPTQSSQSIWPPPPQNAPTQSSQSIWPPPPQITPAQQTAQPAQSIWPNPPATGTQTQ